MLGTGGEVILTNRARSVDLKLQILRRATPVPGLPCFAIVRNERYFLPHFLRHYRALGITHFIFYDDGSTDGSRDILLAQDDCTVLTGDYEFRQVLRNGQPFLYVARNLIPGFFARQGWCLTVDADEFLLLPNEFASLPDVIAFLEARGEKSVLAPMVDLYPATLAERNFERSLGPFEGREWWFDRDPAFSLSPAGRVEPRPGGIRHRLLRMLFDRDPAEFQEYFLRDGGKLSYTKLWKVPLLKTGHGIARTNTHSINAPVPADIRLGIAHFKFYPDLDRKIEDALATNGYARGSFEYRVLDFAIRAIPDQSLLFERSMRFRSPQDLERERLMFA
jgi:hypothetical protein